jgi:hypothetical protein
VKGEEVDLTGQLQGGFWNIFVNKDIKDIPHNFIELNKFLSASADSQRRKQCLHYSGRAESTLDGK